MSGTQHETPLFLSGFFVWVKLFAGQVRRKKRRKGKGSFQGDANPRPPVVSTIPNRTQLID
jgi:hypothetical protein